MNIKLRVLYIQALLRTYVLISPVLGKCRIQHLIHTVNIQMWMIKSCLYCTHLLYYIPSHPTTILNLPLPSPTSLLLCSCAISLNSNLEGDLDLENLPTIHNMIVLYLDIQYLIMILSIIIRISKHIYRSRSSRSRRGSWSSGSSTTAET